jgi:hypothetical protein
MDRAKTEAYEREMKGRKENQIDTKPDIIIIYVPSRRKRMLRSIQWHSGIFFPPPQSSIWAARK